MEFRTWLAENHRPDKQRFLNSLRELQPTIHELAKHLNMDYEEVYERVESGDGRILDQMWDFVWSRGLNYHINVITAYTKS